ncbi:MAG: MoaD/ThiS family protein [Rhodothermaceae bacterium]|nr:MoaD/ThiS family protein [Rhodothermaceae bacterium]
MASFQIQLYSVLRSKLATASVNLEAHDGVTAGEVMDSICDHYPLMAPYRNIMRLAINQEYASEARIIHSGDELALITPVSGG